LKTFGMASLDCARLVGNSEIIFEYRECCSHFGANAQRSRYTRKVKQKIVNMDVFRSGSLTGGYVDVVAVEEPLQICLDDRDLAVVLRTPGNDEELTVGFLCSQGNLHSREDIAEITCGVNSAGVKRVQDPGLITQQRHPSLTPGSGICRTASVELLVAAGCRVVSPDDPLIDASIILRLPETMRDNNQPIFDRTRGLHAAALLDVQGNLQLVREDVGRHNAVDKLVGRALLDGRVPLSDSVLLVSGAASLDLVQKALMAGVPVLATLGAPSSLAVEAALHFGLTLVGFVRNGRFQTYSGEARISPL
jgi:FdhD protein